MKIGLVVECGPDGAETKIIPHLLRLHRGDVEFAIPSTMDSKGKLMKEGIISAKNMVIDGCDKVIVIWDLLPAFPDEDQAACLKIEKDYLLQQIGELDDDIAEKIFLVCVPNMLEAWLIADERAVLAMFEDHASRYHRNKDIKFSKVKDPETVPDPKSMLMSKYQKCRLRGEYADAIHGPRIAKKIDNYKRISRCTSFCRLIEKTFDFDIINNRNTH